MAYVERSWKYGPSTKVVGIYLVRSRLWRTYEAVEDTADIYHLTEVVLATAATEPLAGHRSCCRSLVTQIDAPLLDLGREGA